MVCDPQAYQMLLNCPWNKLNHLADSSATRDPSLGPAPQLPVPWPPGGSWLTPDPLTLQVLHQDTPNIQVSGKALGEKARRSSWEPKPILLPQRSKLPLLVGLTGRKLWQLRVFWNYFRTMAVVLQLCQQALSSALFPRPSSLKKHHKEAKEPRQVAV